MPNWERCASVKVTRRVRTLRWGGHWVVGVVALRPLRLRGAGGPWGPKAARRSARRDGSQREPFHRLEPFHRCVWIRPGRSHSELADQATRRQNRAMASSQLNPSAILQTAFSFWASKVLLTAVEAGVFTKLADRRLTGAELGAELQFHPRAIADFFDALVVMKFLGRAGDGPAAKYFNTPEGALFLDENSPRYISGIL